LNHLTPSCRLQAISCVKDGETVSCARNISFFSRSKETTVQSTRLFLECGLGRDEHDSDKSRKSAKEQISMVFHGYSITHIDAFSHFFFKGKMYNNKEASLVTSQEGAKCNTALAFKNGIVGRGVLLDIARLKGRYLQAGEGVLIKDIEEAQKQFDIELQQGDIVLVRTGFYKNSLERGGLHPVEDGTPAIHPECCSLFFKKQIAVVGSDTCNDMYPSPYPNYRNPFHTVALYSMGMPLLDNCNLEELAEMCQQKQRWSFMLTVTALPMEGTTGSPVNPIAMF